MTALAVSGSKVSSPVTWSMTDQYYPAGRTRGSGLLGVEGGVLIVATWFAMMPCPWRRFARVLYWCSFGTLGVSADF